MFTRCIENIHKNRFCTCLAHGVKGEKAKKLENYFSVFLQLFMWKYCINNNMLILSVDLQEIQHTVS